MTQRQLDDLREADLRDHELHGKGRMRVEEDLRHGKAALLPAPREHLSPDQLQTLLMPGQRAILPWRADLTALANYGYSLDEIAAAEDRMDKLAAERIAQILILRQLTG
jgi:hypothetical protein